MKKILAALLVAAFFVTGCDDSAYRKAVRASAGISEGLKKLQDANEASLKAGAIDQDDAKTIALATADAVRANQAIRAELRVAEKLDLQSRAQIVAEVANIAASLKQLNDEGVLHVKNPAAKAKLQTILTGIEASLGVLQSLLEGK